MRANSMLRAITAATALTLAVSGVAAAQSVDERELQFANNLGPTLISAVVTNSLDADDYNALIVQTARNYHNARLGGRVKAPEQPKQNSNKRRNTTQAQPLRGGWISIGPLEGTDEVTQATLELAGGSDPDLLIVSGGDWQSNVGIARSNSATTIIEINAPAACLDENGRADTSGACAGSGRVSGDETDAVGNPGMTPGNYGAMEFAVEEGAYLAGVLAARESRGQRLGIIVGARDCLECDRYVTGFLNGARDTDPDVDIELAYLADDEVAGFSDAASAKTYAEAFIEVYQPGLLMPVGRGATMGMVEAACEAGVKVVGAGVDISTERPEFRQSCVMVSIVPDVARAVEEAMFLFSSGQNPPVITYDLAQGGISLTDEWRVSPTKRVDTNEFYDAAELAILTDRIAPCPDGCGQFAPQPEAAEE